MSAARSGGRLLVDCLVHQGVERVFCVPGESYLAVLDALRDAPIRTVVCRQEGGAAMMAEAHGKLTGSPGVCFVTRGPGATNASSGLHVGFQDSTPMILFVGQAPAAHLEREAFQEIDYRRMFGQLAKWVAQVDDPQRLPEFVSRAFHTAVNGRPGPVVLALPEDALTATADGPAVAACHCIEPHPAEADLERLAELLTAARRPLAIVGGRGWDERSRASLARFAGRWNLPVTCAFRYQDSFDNDHPLYAGDVGIGINPALAAAIGEADLVLAVGIRLGEMTTGGYRLLEPPVARQTLVHVYPGIEELGRVYRPELAIHATVATFSAALGRLGDGRPAADSDWSRRLTAAFADWSAPVANPGEIQLAELIVALRGWLPDDAIVCNGAGNYTAWLHRFFRYRQPRTQLAPTSGSMGYGLPAALAAKLAEPRRMVVALAGDGCFQMTGQEFGTAAQYGAAVIVIVINNGSYGTIRMHQERHYPGRVFATGLANPDFAALARAYGAFGAVVERNEEFLPALDEAVASAGPAIVEVRVDPAAISPAWSLRDGRLQPAR